MKHQWNLMYLDRWSDGCYQGQRGNPHVLPVRSPVSTMSACSDEREITCGSTAGSSLSSPEDSKVLARVSPSFETCGSALSSIIVGFLEVHAVIVGFRPFDNAAEQETRSGQSAAVLTLSFVASPHACSGDYRMTPFKGCYFSPAARNKIKDCWFLGTLDRIRQASGTEPSYSLQPIHLPSSIGTPDTVIVRSQHAGGGAGEKLGSESSGELWRALRKCSSEKVCQQCSRHGR